MLLLWMKMTFCSSSCCTSHSYIFTQFQSLLIICHLLLYQWEGWKLTGCERAMGLNSMRLWWTFICVKWPHKWPNKNKHPHMLITEELSCAICNMMRIPISAFYYDSLANQMTVFIVQTQCSVNGCYVKFVQFTEAEFEYIYKGI